MGLDEKQAEYPMSFAAAMNSLEGESWDVEQRGDGTFLVRVHSCNRNGLPLPDAVFAFRAGDPQYNYWEEKFHERSNAAK
jgi:hypothetical protein